MKYFFLPLFLIIFSTQSRSQVNIQIGKSNEIVYPVTPNETNNHSELISLEKLFTGKKIVGMGEATHGTKEFFNMKTKMFKFLVKHSGYKIFTIEAPFGGTLKVNDYILYGKGDVLSAMKGLQHGAWYTEEVRDLIEWMRLYNNDKPDNDKLKFYGFDCQSFKGPNNALSDYIKDYDNENIAEFLNGSSILNDSSLSYFYYQRNRSSAKKVILIVQEIIAFQEKWFRERQDFYISRSGREKYNLAVHNIENIKQASLLISYSQNNLQYLRDSCMAQNIKWIYEYENSKVFIWAHNGHVCIGATTHIHNWYKPKRMGGFLKDMFGKDYYNIGFAFNEGKLGIGKISDTGGIKEYNFPVYKKNTLTNSLSLSGSDAFFIDLITSDNPVFSTLQRTYNVGAGFINYKRCSDKLIPKEQFDGLIYINKTTRAIAIL